MMHNALFLAHKAYQLRKWSLIQPAHAGSGHPTTCLSAADIVAALFFQVMRYHVEQFDDPDNDRFILSKGHASALLYAVWKELGVLTEDDLLTYRAIDSVLEGHPTFRFSRTEAATGSLGIGLSIGVGQALAAKMDARAYQTYVLLGDSEIAEGSVWEAVQLAAHYRLDNLTAIVDCNTLGQSTHTLYGGDPVQYQKMFAAFGWDAYCVDGHDLDALCQTFSVHQASKKPRAILARTVKGYGLHSVEGKEGYHGKAFDKKSLPAYLDELAARFPDAAQFVPEKKRWWPQQPKRTSDVATASPASIGVQPCSYEQGTMVATRKSYGASITQLGVALPQLVVLDAEVKNSTYAELFEKKYPERFVQSFVAEQNMVSMAVGLERRGKMPFVSTFGAFFARAYDQIRMAAIGQSTIKLSGSHCGVSIGQDGPSQMALEDIALMSALPDSAVLYPSDAVSTQRLVELMAQYDKGISYLRTTRAETPVIYDAHEQFMLGGMKLLKQSAHDVACIVAAGITLFEALKAHEQLRVRGVHVAVVDLYSIKPLGAEQLISYARAAGNKILVVEDHYLQGGIGQHVGAAVCNSGITVHMRAVTQLPRSGKPEELMAWAGIDAAGIVEAVALMVS